MSQRCPLLIFVGADKGGVGKTMISRVVADYAMTHGVTPHFIDTQPGGDLRRYYPSAELIDVEKVAGQMKLFDQLTPTSTVLIDIRAGLLSPVLIAMRNHGLLADAKAGHLRIVVLHVLAPIKTSLREVEEVAGMLAPAGEGKVYAPIQNHINDTAFPDFPAINIPQLSEEVCEALDKNALTMEGFVAEQTNSRVLRGALRHWLDRCYAELDRAGLRDELRKQAVTGRV